MAITIEQQPNSYSPVFNPMNFVLSSNNLSHNFFYFLCKVKDSAGDVIYQDRFSPRPDNSLCLFDVSRALEKYCLYDVSGIKNGTLGVRYATSIYKEFTVQFVEETGSVASAIASGASTTSSNKYAYNGVFDFESFISYSDASYVMASAANSYKFMTDMRGGNIRIKTTERFDLGIMTSAGATQPVKNIQIKTYDSAGTIIGTYKIANSYSSGTTTADMFLNVLVGAGDLNSQTLSSGSQPIITDSVYTYTVGVENNSGTLISELLTFEIDRRCNNNETIRLYWLNKLGRFDAFTFNFESERSIDIVRQRYRKLNGAFSGATFSYATHERGLTNYYTQVDKKIKVRTDFINNVEAEWLQNLATSPLIFGEVDGVLVNLMLDTNTYLTQTVERNKLFSVEFDLMFSNSSYRQRL